MQTKRQSIVELTDKFVINYLVISIDVFLIILTLLEDFVLNKKCVLI